VLARGSDDTRAVPAASRRSAIARAAIGFSFAAASLFAAAVPAYGIHTGHIQGKILDEKGKPIEGALVTITGPEAIGIWQCRTDEKGFYRIAGLEASRELTVRVEAEERAIIERMGYTLHDDQTLHLNFRLRPKGVFYTLVIIDPRVPYHKTALAGARTTLPPGLRVFEVTERTPAVNRKLRRVLATRPDGVLAIGSLPARLAREIIFDIPVVYTMVLDPFKEGLRTGNMCGVPANGAFSEQVDMLQKMAPEAHRIGVIFEPDRLGGVVAQLRDEVVGAGLTLEARAIHDPNTISEKLASIAQAGVDAFMVLLDPGLYTNAVFHQILRFARERGIIVIAPDGAMVRAGATFSYAPGFEELGAYAGRLLTNVMKRKVTVPEIGIIYPRTRYFSLNPEDAQRLHLEMPPELKAIPHQSDAAPVIIKPGG